jgi:hypothetical protein
MPYIQPSGLMRGAPDFTHVKSDRFLFSLDSDPTIKLVCKSATRPSINNTEIEINHINKKRYILGKTTYDPLQIILYDYITPSISQLLMAWQVTVHEAKSGRSGYDAFYNRTATLEILGPAGDVVQVWKYFNCKPTTINFGELNWDNDTVMEIPVTIRYDEFELVV